MKKQLAASIIIVSVPFLFVSCVSTLFKQAPPTFSDEIHIQAPEGSFEKTKTSVYPSWKSSETGNVISVVSDCSSAAYSLTNMHLLIEDSLEQIKVLKEETRTLLNSPAVYRSITAKLDGHLIEIYSVSFKKKSCGYVSSLSGKAKNLESDKPAFEQFLNGLTFE